MSISFKERRSLSVHSQVLIIALIPALVVTSIVSVVVYRGTIVQGKRALTQQGQMLATQLASELEYALSVGAVDQLADTIASTIDPTRRILGIEIGRVSVFDKDDRVLYATFLVDPADARSVPAEDVQVFTASVYLNPIGLELYPGSKPARRYLGKVDIEMLTAPIKAKHFGRFLRDLTLVLATFCIALGLAHWTGRRFSSSIKEAANAISGIKGGDLGIRIRPTETNEIGTLQGGVNLLAETLASSRARLERELNRVRGEYNQTLEELRIQTQEAQQASQAKSMFLAKISHEMRTPLYSIQGLAERVLKAKQNPDEKRDVQAIHSAAHKLHRIISDILDYTQLEGGKYLSPMRPLDLWAEIEAETETIGPLASQQKLYLDVIVEPSVPQTVMGDGKAFRTIVANLLSNAVKFTETGGITIELGIESLQDAIVNIRLQVSDTGQGIPEEHLTSIFTPFEQVDGALNRRYGGSGLGLSIVKGYCDRLGGRITVDSQVGRGSTFTVVLPFRTTCVSTRDRSAVSTGQLATVESIMDKPFEVSEQSTVLVVEDFEINRAIMAHQLESNGFHVIEACDGEEAVAKTVQGGVDLILMDIQMPGKDGLTAIREIRDLPAGARLAIVGFTASADKPTHRRIMEAGADAVLTKPISEAELITAVQQTLLMRKAQKIPALPLQSSRVS